MFYNVFFIILLGFPGYGTHLQNSMNTSIVYSHNPDRDNPDLIRFKIAKFSVKKGAPRFDKIGLEGRSYKKGEKGHYLIQFAGPIRREWINAIKEMGVDFPGEYYIPNHAMVGRASSEIVDRILSLNFVQWVGKYKPAYRISPNLLNTQKAEIGTNMFGGQVYLDKPGTIMLMVHIFDGESWGTVVDSIQKMGGKILTHTNNTVGGPNFIRVRIPEDKSIDIAKAIANMENVFWVERYYQPHILNAWTRWINQSSATSGMGDATTNGWNAQLSVNATETPIYNHGIFGQGQVVGESDTGIDWDNPWWYETSGDMNFNGSGTSYSGTDGTKIKGYQTLSDDHDSQSNNLNSSGNGSEGHGTHTSTTICGDSLWHDPSADGILARGDGMAPMAKMAFQDISTTPTGTNGDALDGIPSDLDTLFLWAYNAGARIHSNSWGSSASSYTTDAMNCDKFMWNHKDFLVFFAMGNAGPNSGTIGSPATAKDMVSVGANQGGAGCNVPATGRESTVWQNPGDVEDRYGDGWNTDGIPDDDFETVAWFSSHGPSDEGLRKPEICTSGGHMIFSGWSTGDATDGTWADPAAPNSGATSNGTYLCQMGGTSMATPAAAGLCILVRQYYTEGWYPSGSKNASDAITPSAALMKATMIAATRNMTGYYTGDSGDKSTHVDVPTNGQGWGRVVLNDALYFSGDTIGTLIYDNLTVDQGNTDIHSFTAGNKVDLKIVMAYTDYYGTQSSSDPLVNDLNLRVVVDGTSYYGNVFSGGYSTTGGSYDNVNPVEVVWIPKSSLSKSKSSVEVRVIGAEESHTPQPFALAITGDVNQTIAVDISNFTYSVLQDGIKIYWRTETDVNTKKWEIEKTEGLSNKYSLVYTTHSLVANGPHNYYYKDIDCSTGKVYKYRLIKVDVDGTKKHYGPIFVRYTGSKLKFGIPKTGKNPFSKNFWFEYAISKSGYTQIKIFDITGRSVKTLFEGERQPGKYRMTWDAEGISQGVYFLKLMQEEQSKTIKLIKIQ